MPAGLVHPVRVGRSIDRWMGWFGRSVGRSIGRSIDRSYLPAYVPTYLPAPKHLVTDQPTPPAHGRPGPACFQPEIVDSRYCMPAGLVHPVRVGRSIDRWMGWVGRSVARSVGLLRETGARPTPEEWRAGTLRRAL